MFKKLSIILALLVIHSYTAYSAPKETKLQFEESVNTMENPGFENKLAGWSEVGSGAFAHTVTAADVAVGKGAATFDAAANNDHILSKAIAIPNALKSKDCTLSFFYKDGDVNYTASVFDGTSDVSGTATVLSTQSSYIEERVSFTCPASGTVQFKLNATNAAAVAIKLDKIFIGSSISQAAAPIENLSVITNVTGDSPVTVLTTNDMYIGDTSSGAITYNIYTAIGNEGKVVRFKNVAKANRVTLDPFGSQTIDGATTYKMDNDDSILTLISDGSNWQIVANYPGFRICWWVSDDDCISGPCTITSQSGCISSISRPSVGRRNVFFGTTWWSGNPSCSGTTGDADTGIAGNSNNLPAAALWEFNIETSSSGAQIDDKHAGICIGK